MRAALAPVILLTLALAACGVTAPRGSDGYADLDSLGIAMITARIRTGKLKVSSACVNLINEAKLYRYPSPAERAQLGENPIDAHNHALAALRYLVTRITKPAAGDVPIAAARSGESRVARSAKPNGEAATCTRATSAAATTISVNR